MRKVLLIAMFAFGLTGISLAQTANDFWHAFEKCADASQFQAHYPSPSQGQVLNLAVMDNGIQIPSVSGITFLGTRTFSLEDKGTVIGNNYSEFFIIQDARFTSSGAHFEVIYYYNFDGSYTTFVRGQFELTNSSGTWAVTSTTIL